MKIFVQITSYRDPELCSTIKDCIRRAKRPENLYFGICWQRDEEENLNDLADIKNPSNVRIADFSWKKSEGSGWARSIAQTLYQNEEYTLQIDSHHRFEKDWDESLIKMIEELNSEKPIISSFAGAYRASNGEKLSTEPYKIAIAGFDEEKIPTLRPDYIPEWEKLGNPIRARFICGHYIFARGNFCVEYKYDPEIYFEGQDILLSARCFTMGYELFHPNKNFIWHEYHRGDKKKHWTDHTEELKNKGEIEKSWKERNDHGKNKVKQILGTEDNGIDISQYGLGNVKSLMEYQIYSGVDFSKQLLHPTSNSIEPNLNLTDEQTWNAQMAGVVEPKKEQDYLLQISWEKDEIEFADDYDFWFFGFHDQEGKQIYRKDLNWQQDKEILEFKKSTKEVAFRSDKEPKTCIIWPHSKSRGWLKKIETTL